MLTSSAVMSITNDLALSPHDRRSASQPPRRESATSNATRTRPHTVSAETRHCYAQRHADNGTPPDVLRDLMGHDSMQTTLAYYRVTEKRVRSAWEDVSRHQFDGQGLPVLTAVAGLLADEHTRLRVGQVAVPFGICTEPSNVKAGGHACPYKFTLHRVRTLPKRPLVPPRAQILPPTTPRRPGTPSRRHGHPGLGTGKGATRRRGDRSTTFADKANRAQPSRPHARGSEDHPGCGERRPRCTTDRQPRHAGHARDIGSDA